MVKQKGLGRGLDALLSGNVENNAEEILRSISIEQLKPGKYQPRSYMDPESLNNLAESIKAQGIMQPILVREISDNQYEIIAGERRWRAARIAGLEEVPVLIRVIADEAALAMALIENIQRENLNPIEEANGIKRLIDEFGMTHETAAISVGRSRSAVTNLLRLQNLSDLVQEKLMRNLLDMGHARALLSLTDAQQILASEEIIQKQLSVREAEMLVKRISNSETKNKKTVTRDNDVVILQQELSELIGAEVQIANTANGSGTLKIRYSNLDQLEGIISKLR